MWVRQLVRSLAGDGRTVFLSSHLMSEMALTADHIIVIGRGAILADAPVSQILAAASGNGVRVRSPQATELAALITSSGAQVTSSEPGLLYVNGTSAVAVGELAASAGLVLHELTTVESTLEAAYMELTADSVEYQSAPTHPAPSAAPAHPRTTAAGEP